MANGSSKPKQDIVFRISDYFLGREFAATLSGGDRRRLALYYLLSIVGIITIFSIGSLAFVQGNRLLALFDYVSAGTLLVNLAAAHRYRKFDINILIGISVVAMLFVYVFLTGGQNNSAFIWYYTFPLAALFLLGPARGMVVALVILLPVVFLFFFDERLPYLASYSPDIKLRFIPSYLVILIFTFLFEHSREKVYGDLQEANNRLRELDSLKSMFLASMSHELRTPLNAIIGFTGVLLQELPGDLNDEQRRQLSMIQASSRHLHDLVNDVIDINRIEADMVQLCHEEFDTGRLVCDICESLAYAAKEKSLDLHVFPEEGRFIRSDPKRVRQVLMNLIDNAIKYTGSGRITVRSGVEHDRMIFAVEDTGAGISHKDRLQLFQPFRQLHPSDSGKGTGLGLFISQRLAGILGGEIKLDSAIGRGSTFTFALPLEP